MDEISPVSRLPVTLFAWFLGIFGAHRFYLGKPGTAVLMLLTAGGVGIWALVDFIMAITGSMRDKEGRLIRSWNPPEPAQQTSLPQTAGILCIVAGAIGFINGIVISAIGATLATDILFGFGLFGAPAIVFGILAIVGGVFTLQRRYWGLALAGAICALLSTWWIGILAIIFTAISQKEFAQIS